MMNEQKQQHTEEMKIIYLFGNTELGELTKKDSKVYVYNSNVLNEQKLYNTSEGFKASNYSLWNSIERESTFLFSDFIQLLHVLSSKELIKSFAKISGKESDWEKLIKFAKLDYYTRTFYVQLADKGVEEKPNS